MQQNFHLGLHVAICSDTMSRTEIYHIVMMVFKDGLHNTWAEASLCGIHEERFLHTLPESNPLSVPKKREEKKYI